MLDHISDETLREMYIGKRMTYQKIADKIGCSASAICLRMKESGIKARSVRDYPATQKQRDAWKRIGKSRSGVPRTESQKAKQSATMKGRRKRNYEFGGHEKLRKDGYVKVYAPDHPHATADGYVMKHTLVMERHIGRYLADDEVVHHINKIRDDNRLENLLLMKKHDHQRMHMLERRNGRRETKC